ncbi:MAG TPA: diaminopropionate ammonia-lyase [bacterium]|jgi:diaminopropionate ammonia-lyase|nr:diaminopropionate ammonia-lyase [bacterium]
MADKVERLGLGSILAGAVRQKFAQEPMPVFLDPRRAEQVREFHRSWPTYKPTPLANLANLALELGVGHVYVKDESARFGLNAFKGLGSSYAIGKFIAAELGLPAEKLTFDCLRSKEVRQRLGKVTFATATAGNHGRGVAWTAQQLRQQGVVYLPRGAARRRVEAVMEAGSKAVVTTLNYDDTVELVKQQAKENGWHLIQDTAWPGYEEIPRWIMQGYTTIAAEIDDQLKDQGLPEPTHLFLQAGVGSFASAILGYFVNRNRERYPITVIMEPDRAACIFESAKLGEKETKQATGDLGSIMAGLSCKEPSPIAWSIIRSFADSYFICPDYVAAQGMRILANPLGNDPPLVAGESGAVGIGLLSLLTMEPECARLQEKLGLDQEARVLIISTEGDTDPDNYRQIIWNGKYPLPQPVE